MEVESRNFGFLAQHDPLLSAYAARAEIYVFDDPNTSLVKTRQFAEYLARHVAAHRGLETQGMEFGSVLRMLTESRLIPRDVRDLFDMIRLRGNEAAHDHRGDQQTALASLISAYQLSVWFQRVFADPDFSQGPFRPLMAPDRAGKALREEVDLLRSEVARYEQELAESNGKIAKVEELVRSLEAEAKTFEQEKEMLTGLVAETLNEQGAIEAELGRVRQQAARSTATDLQSFIERSRQAARRIARRGEADTHVPLGRVRFVLERLSSCCNATLLLTQYSQGGFVKACCIECRSFDAVSIYEFDALDLWLSCPKCPHRRLNRARVGSNFGFRCPDCGWSCLLASLLPNWNELFR